MQIKSGKQTAIKRETNCTIIRMDWKQVKQSTPFCTLGLFAERKQTSGKPTLKCTQNVRLFSNGRVVNPVFYGTLVI